MNPNAIIFWSILGILGFLISGPHGALIGVLIGLILSFLVAFL